MVLPQLEEQVEMALLLHFLDQMLHELVVVALLQIIQDLMAEVELAEVELETEQMEQLILVEVLEAEMLQVAQV